MKTELKLNSRNYSWITREFHPKTIRMGYSFGLFLRFVLWFVTGFNSSFVYCKLDQVIELQIFRCSEVIDWWPLLGDYRLPNRPPIPPPIPRPPMPPIPPMPRGPRANGPVWREESSLEEWIVDADSADTKMLVGKSAGAWIGQVGESGSIIELQCNSVRPSKYLAGLSVRPHLLHPAGHLRHLRRPADHRPQLLDMPSSPSPGTEPRTARRSTETSSFQLVVTCWKWLWLRLLGVAVDKFLS